MISLLHPLHVRLNVLFPVEKAGALPKVLPWAALVAVGMLIAAGCARHAAPQSDGQSNTLSAERLQELFEGGQTYEEFMDDEPLLNRLWHHNYQRGEVIREDLLARAQVIPGRWHLLVVTGGGDLDSPYTVPYLARLADRVAGLQLRIIDPDSGREILREHPAPDGHPATPTVLLLDSDYNQAGCWIQRPAELRRFYKENRDEYSEAELTLMVTDWYTGNRGIRTHDEVLRLMSAASAGDPVCPVPLEGP